MSRAAETINQLEENYRRRKPVETQLPYIGIFDSGKLYYYTLYSCIKINKCEFYNKAL